MALGGGIWAVQNKVLPGTYINFSSVAKASATLSDRGYAAMPLMLDWGPDSTVFTVTSGDFQKNSLKIFGHAYTDDALLPLRELFQYTQTLYAYRLNGGGAKAACAYCTAKYSGIAGNKLYVVIAANADNADLFDVSLYYDTTLLDTQTVAAATALKDIPAIFAELATATGFYYSKAKAENRIKLRKKYGPDIYNDSKED